MIPKKIHYFWFGNNPKTKFIESCIKSWKKLGYEIYEWNETNYDLNKHIYLKENYKNKNWAFVTDYARLDILYNEGGLYFDTDVRINKKIPDKMLKTDFLIGFQFDCLLGTHLLASKKESKIIKKFLEIYDTYNLDIKNPNNNLFNDYFIHNIDFFKLNGKTQELIYLNEKINIYPKSKFSSMGLFSGNYAIHLLDNSWRSKNKIKKQFQNIFKKLIGDRIYYNLIAYKALKISPYFERYLKDSRS